MKIAVIVPTLNAGTTWQCWIDSLLSQSVTFDKAIVIDSSSTDETVNIATSAGLTVKKIKRSEFNHGGTRQAALDLCPDSEIVFFLTQDAILAAPNSVENLLHSFDDPRIGAAFGRQLPHRDAGPIGSHARLFNYPDQGRVCTFTDRSIWGIKTAFISNSFAAYRRTALDAVGGFPADVIFGEDTFTAARILMSGWAVAYCAEAQVCHSHDYTIAEEFRRSFDIGVFHSRESWLLESFGQAEREGARFVQSELRYLAKRCPSLLPSACLRTGAKILGYRLGRFEARLPNGIKKKLSMSKTYWNPQPR